MQPRNQVDVDLKSVRKAVRPSEWLRSQAAVSTSYVLSFEKHTVRLKCLASLDMAHLVRSTDLRPHSKSEFLTRTSSGRRADNPERHTKLPRLKIELLWRDCFSAQIG